MKNGSPYMMQNMTPGLLKCLNGFESPHTDLRGYDLVHLTKPQVERHQNRYSLLTPYQRLAATVAAEHLTAILADDLMKNKDHFADQGLSLIHI